MASRLLQFHLQIVCEENTTFPDILSPNYLRLVFDTVAGIARNEDDDEMPDGVRVIYEVFMKDLVNIRIQPLNATSNIKTYFMQQWARSISLHINTHFRTMCMRYVQERLFRRGLPMKQAKYMSKLLYEYATSTSAQNNGDQVEDDGQSEFSTELDSDEGDSDEQDGHNMSEALTAQTIDPVWVPYVQFIQDHNVSTEERVKAIYITNEMFTRWSTKVYCLVPLHKWQAKYVPIDTTILYDLLGQTSGTGMSRDQFKERQVEIWQTHFQIPRSLYNEPAEMRKQFQYFITTDGVGASITTGRWRWVVRREETPAQKKARIAQERQDALDRCFTRIRDRSETEDFEWIGVDPGRKYVVTAAALDERWKYKISSGQYHHEIKSNERRQHTRRVQRRQGLSEWLLEMPTFKTHCSEATQDTLQQLFQGDNLARQFDISLSRNSRHYRWKVYIHRQKTFHKICKGILGGRDPRNTVIAFGSAMFGITTRGYPSCPSKSRVISNMLRYCYRAYVISVREFNTSQVCSNCCEPVKLCGVGTRRDPFREYREGSTAVANHHFVRRCSNQTCGTIWHRDVNAARNMVLLALYLVYQMDRPDEYSHQLPKARIVHQARDDHEDEN